MALLDERGWQGFTVDEVARRCGVSKATIYKHWRGGFELAVEAYGAVVTNAVPVVSSGDVAEDLRDQVIRFASFYASPRGRVAAQLLGAATFHEHGGALVSATFFGARRLATEKLITEGVATGSLRSGLHPRLAVDLLFGPIMFRLFNGLDPIDATEAVVLAEMGIRTLLSSPRQ